MKKLSRYLLTAVFLFLVFTPSTFARYYDPEVGRFLSEDPIGFEGGDVNVYNYTSGNPVNWVDPEGLVEVSPGHYDSPFGSGPGGYLGGGGGGGFGGGRGRSCSPTIDTRTGSEVGRFVVDPQGNIMIEPKGGRTVPGPNGDIYTLYPNGSNYQRLNPQADPPHGHGHLPGTGPYMRGQGPSIDPLGNVVPWNSPDAHWPIK